MHGNDESGNAITADGKAGPRVAIENESGKSRFLRRRYPHHGRMRNVGNESSEENFRSRYYSSCRAIAFTTRKGFRKIRTSRIQDSLRRSEYKTAVAAGIVDGVPSRTSGVPTNSVDLQTGWPQPSGESPRGDRAQFVQHAVKRSSAPRDRERIGNVKKVSALIAPQWTYG